MNNLDVSIILVSYNTLEFTRNCLKSIFENQELLYLGKIKIADYLVQLSEEHAKTNRTLISEVKKVIKTYGERTHKKLVKLLIKEVGV